MLTLIPRALARICLALTFLLAGLMVCIHAPFVTEFLSHQTSISAEFGVSQATIAQASLAARDYALGTIGTEGLKSTLSGLGLPAEALDASMLTHLQDCTGIFTIFTNLFIALAIASVASIVLTAVFSGSDGTSGLLWQSAVLALVVIVAFGFRIFTSFESFFTWMHTLFFSAGTWTFASDSLLISMFPQNFWIGMGAIWGGVSIILSVIAIIVAQCISGH